MPLPTDHSLLAIHYLLLTADYSLLAPCCVLLTTTPYYGVSICRAVVFFPGFLDGNIDPLLYHEAEAPGETKWVSQIWVRQIADPSRTVPKAWVDALKCDPYSRAALA